MRCAGQGWAGHRGDEPVCSAVPLAGARARWVGVSRLLNASWLIRAPPPTAARLNDERHAWLGIGRAVGEAEDARGDRDALQPSSSPGKRGGEVSVLRQCVLPRKA